jgi:hypothetical protein
MDPTVTAALYGAAGGAAVSAIGSYIGYRLTLRVQAEHTRQLLVNDALVKVTAGLNDAQRWLGMFAVRLERCASTLEMERGSTSGETMAIWQDVANQLRSLSADAPTTFGWQTTLEDNASLLPEMRDVRIQIGHEQRLLVQSLTDLFATVLGSLVSPDGRARRRAVLEHPEVLRRRIADQQALYEDLKVLLQDYGVDGMTGQRVSHPASDPKRPRVVEREGTVVLVPRPEVAVLPAPRP